MIFTLYVNWSSPSVSPPFQKKKIQILFIYLFIYSNLITQMIKTKRKEGIKYIYKYKKEISE